MFPDDPHLVACQRFLRESVGPEAPPGRTPVRIPLAWQCGATLLVLVAFAALSLSRALSLAILVIGAYVGIAAYQGAIEEQDCAAQPLDEVELEVLRFREQLDRDLAVLEAFDAYYARRERETRR